MEQYGRVINGVYELVRSPYKKLFTTVVHYVREKEAGEMLAENQYDCLMRGYEQTVILHERWGIIQMDRIESFVDGDALALRFPVLDRWYGVRLVAHEGRGRVYFLVRLVYGTESIWT